jgi:hypothetical protein
MDEWKVSFCPQCPLLYVISRDESLEFFLVPLLEDTMYV